MTGDGTNCQGLPDHMGIPAAIGFKRLQSIARERSRCLGIPAVIARDHSPGDCISCAVI